MATLLVLVVVVVAVLECQPAACTIIAQTDIQEVCDGYLTPQNITKTLQCPEPPCNTTTGLTTLSLPFLLSLPNTSHKTCTTKLYLYNTTMSGCGIVVVKWQSDQQEQLLLEAKTCDSPEEDNNITNQCSVPSGGGGEWLHVEVEMTEGLQVTLYHIQGQVKRPLLTLPSKACLPSQVMVRRCDSQGYGYSAPIPIPTTVAINTALVVALPILLLLAVIAVALCHYKTRHSQSCTTAQLSCLTQRQAAPHAAPASVTQPSFPTSRHDSTNSLYGEIM